VKPTVTVAIPSYNHGQYLGEAIASALAQTFPVDEVIVVENASSDNSLDVARGFQDPRVRVHENFRKIDGTSNWNRCFELAGGDYVVLLHADDALAPTMVERLMDRAMREPNAVIVNCDYEMLFVEHGQSRVFGMWHHHGETVRNQTFDGRTMIEMMLKRGDNSIGTTSMQLIKRNAIRAVKGLDPTAAYVTDWEFAMRLLAQHGGLANVAEPLVKYRMHAQNGTSEDILLDTDVRGHFELLQKLVNPEHPFGELSGEAIHAYRMHTAARLVNKLRQLAALDDSNRKPGYPTKEWRMERLIGWAQDPVFAGVIRFGSQAQTATTPA
jgi:glycosyltransferase involved in cell wall biosynthesis